MEASRRLGGDAGGEALLCLPCRTEDVQLATAIRSTTLLSSLAAIERWGKLEEYQRRLPSEAAAGLTELAPASWVPMTLGMAHYATVEQLGFSASEARSNGRHVSQTVQNNHFAVLVRALGSSVSVWSVLPRLPAFLGRLLQGGECAVYRLGPKDARVELHGIPIAEFEYVRNGWTGMFESTLELMTRKVYARDLSPSKTKTVAVLGLSWV
jgi:hypothetical protein